MRGAPVLFDVDETLLDWTVAIDLAVDAALSELGLSGEPLAARSLWAEIRAFTWRHRDGMIVDRSHWRLLFEPGEPIDRAFPDRRASTRRKAASRFRDHLRPVLFSDVIPALDKLGDRPLGVLSNSPLARKWLERVAIADRFEQIVMADDAYRKPHPAAFASACEALKATPATVAFVGDSIAADVEGALSAGHLRVVWIDRFHDGYPLTANVTRVESLLDLPAAL